MSKSPIKGLAPRILLPMQLRRLREDEILTSYTYNPLERMGLLEHDGDAACLFGIAKKSRIKTTRLWRKFLWFDWQP